MAWSDAGSEQSDSSPVGCLPASCPERLRCGVRGGGESGSGPCRVTEAGVPAQGHPSACGCSSCSAAWEPYGATMSGVGGVPATPAQRVSPRAAAAEPGGGQGGHEAADTGGTQGAASGGAADRPSEAAAGEAPVEEPAGAAPAAGRDSDNGGRNGDNPGSGGGGGGDGGGAATSSNERSSIKDTEVRSCARAALCMLVVWSKGSRCARLPP